jgi:hypothetical protein
VIANLHVTQLNQLIVLIVIAVSRHRAVKNIDLDGMLTSISALERLINTSCG